MRSKDMRLGYPMKPERYPAQVFWSDDDDGYIAIAPDLPGCSAFGESREEALSELLHAIEAWVAAARAAGNAVPEPSKPAHKAQFSGKTLLRMPVDLHAKLAKGASEEGISLNHFIVYLLTSALTTNNMQRARHLNLLTVHLNNYSLTVATPTAHMPQHVSTWSHRPSPPIWSFLDDQTPILSTSSSVSSRIHQIA
ncbi:type II toxin-antitoxin system HicB family antitoxin [Mesorhizobium sp.]|uniref:type II toxin-antitoxin system HicB family antitoxin n=2 Tax=Mesorhizobium sp. TaxID=1871066 RepID=UPI002581072D|nr:type II toxin-antitoxin system HicB family antitoxin [Mesorhizobium sp.]